VITATPLDYRSIAYQAWKGAGHGDCSAWDPDPGYCSGWYLYPGHEVVVCCDHPGPILMPQIAAVIDFSPEAGELRAAA
jgi:hypothetical protein